MMPECGDLKKEIPHYHSFLPCSDSYHHIRHKTLQSHLPSPVTLEMEEDDINDNTHSTARLVLWHTLFCMFTKIRCVSCHCDASWGAGSCAVICLYFCFSSLLSWRFNLGSQFTRFFELLLQLHILFLVFTFGIKRKLFLSSIQLCIQ